MLLAPRYLPRLATMVGLFTRYGLRDFARRQGFHALVPAEFGGVDDREEDLAVRASAFRRRLVELGPAYVKLGQLLSTRPDLIPEPYIRELERLQDDVGAIPFAEVEAAIQRELGGRISKLFSAFDHEPLGTASLGQVHAAELRDGRAVVVKVQRPGIREQLAEDIEFFHELAQFMSAHTPVGERVDMLGIIQQLERALADELDYRIEARNAATFRRALAGFPHLLIPKVIEAYTSERVLTTERIRGMKIDSVPPVVRLEHDFELLADQLAKAYLKQITIDGHFHADPHPGNIFIVLPGRDNPKTPSELAAHDRRAETRPAATPLSTIEHQAQHEAAPQPRVVGPKLALVDFGMTARLSGAMRDKVVRLLLDIADNRGDAAGETLVEIGQTIETFDRAAYVREVADLVGRNYDRSIGEVEMGRLLYELLNISYRHGLKLPAELTLLAKTLSNLDAAGRALDPSYSPAEAIRDFGRQIATERARRELSPSRIFRVATQAADLVSALPHRVDLITARLAANDFGVRVDAPQLPALLAGMQKIANRVFSGLVLGGLLVASAMLLPYQRELGVTGFLIAAALGVYMVATILISDRRDRG